MSAHRLTLVPWTEAMPGPIGVRGHPTTSPEPRWTAACEASALDPVEACTVPTLRLIGQFRAGILAIEGPDVFTLCRNNGLTIRYTETAR